MVIIIIIVVKMRKAYQRMAQILKVTDTIMDCFKLLNLGMVCYAEDNKKYILMSLYFIPLLFLLFKNDSMMIKKNYKFLSSSLNTDINLYSSTFLIFIFLITKI